MHHLFLDTAFGFNFSAGEKKSIKVSLGYQSVIKIYYCEGYD